MEQKDFDEDWEAASKELLTEMKAWRREHPRASWAEMEGELDRRLRKLRSEMLEDMAQASALANVRALPVEERPVCPHCGRHMGPRGQETRTLKTNGDHEITLTRSYVVCPHCRTGVFPPR
jgi:NADH pyrophosphatase NudC (nudix superfamily)